MYWVLLVSIPRSFKQCVYRHWCLYYYVMPKRSFFNNPPQRDSCFNCISIDRSLPRCKSWTRLATYWWQVNVQRYSKHLPKCLSRHSNEWPLGWPLWVIIHRCEFSTSLPLVIGTNPLPHVTKVMKFKGNEPTSKESEPGTFTPLVKSASDGFARQAITFYKRLANLLATKHNQRYSKTLRCRLTFSLLRSANQCILEAQGHLGESPSIHLRLI